jgi:hypothetical protein
MSRSLNETHKLVKDAARGSGLSFGEAEELASAAVWLEVSGVTGVINASRAIDEYLNGLAGGVECVQKDGWLLTPQYAKGDGRIGALAAGLCARDLVAAAIASGENGHIATIKSVFLPFVAIGLLAPLDPGLANRMVIEIRNSDGQVTATIIVTSNSVNIYESHIDAKPSHPLVDLTIATGMNNRIAQETEGRCIWSPDTRQQALERGLSPNAHACNALASLARNCLVPATEESRLKGAGAGTVDRD